MEDNDEKLIQMIKRKREFDEYSFQKKLRKLEREDRKLHSIHKRKK